MFNLFQFVVSFLIFLETFTKINGHYYSFVKYPNESIKRDTSVASLKQKEFFNASKILDDLLIFYDRDTRPLDQSILNIFNHL